MHLYRLGVPLLHAALDEDVENLFIHEQQMILHDGMMKKVFSRVNSNRWEQFPSTPAFLRIRSDSVYLHCKPYGMIITIWKTFDGLLKEVFPNFSIPKEYNNFV